MWRHCPTFMYFRMVPMNRLSIKNRALTLGRISEVRRHSCTSPHRLFHHVPINSAYETWKSSEENFCSPLALGNHCRGLNVKLCNQAYFRRQIREKRGITESGNSVTLTMVFYERVPRAKACTWEGETEMWVLTVETRPIIYRWYSHAEMVVVDVI